MWYNLQYMKELQDRLAKEAAPLAERVLRMSALVNHQVDCGLMERCAAELLRRLAAAGCRFDKVLTLESSGIAFATLVALRAGVPMVFARKSRPITMGECHRAAVWSYTKEAQCEILVDREFLRKGDRVLFVDDMLATGSGALGALDLCQAAEAEVAALGFLVDKRFQGGYDLLKARGLKVFCLAPVKSLEGGKISFLEEE